MRRASLIGGIVVASVLISMSGRDGQSQAGSSSVDCPDVPRISAQKAHLLYKSGKAILIQADAAKVFKGRRIMGALNFDQEAVCEGRMKLPKFPRKGKLIITFCF